MYPERKNSITFSTTILKLYFDTFHKQNIYLYSTRICNINIEILKQTTDNTYIYDNIDRGNYQHN